MTLTPNAVVAALLVVPVIKIDIFVAVNGVVIVPKGFTDPHGCVSVSVSLEYDGRAMFALLICTSACEVKSSE